MRNANRFGLTSLMFGALAIFIAFTATHAYSIRDWGSWFVFDVMNRFGLFQQSGSAIAEATSFNVFSMNEANAISWTYALAVMLAVTSILAAVRAEVRSEDTLYLSGGFICGSLSILVIDRLWGILVLILGFSVLMLARKKCREP